MKGIPLFILISLLLLVSIVSATDYCTPPGSDINVTYVHEGNWFNFTITSPSCYVCSDNGAGYGDVDCVPCTETPPVTTFTTNVTCGVQNVSVQFNDTSTLSPTSWYWMFGDGNTSTDQNPTYYYDTIGSYTINHSSTNTYGTSWNNKTDYITVAVPGTYCSGGGTFSRVYETNNLPLILGFGAVLIIGLLIFLFGVRR